MSELLVSIVAEIIGVALVALFARLIQRILVPQNV
jgi:hypothetical protein